MYILYDSRSILPIKEMSTGLLILRCLTLAGLFNAAICEVCFIPQPVSKP